MADADTVKPCIANGANVNMADILGHTPLHYAYTADKARLLLAGGAWVNATSKNGETPLRVRNRLLADLQENERSPDAAIAVPVGMDALELHVKKTGAHNEPKIVLRMHVLFQRGQRAGHTVRGRWHEGGIAGTRAPDPGNVHSFVTESP